MTSYIRWSRELRLTDVALVGGKTASLGELYGELGAAGVRVPNGFADGARRARRKVGICGQAPSDHPEMVRFLVAKGITSISLNPDAVMRGLETIAAAEADLHAPSGVAAAKARP